MSEEKKLEKQLHDLKTKNREDLKKLQQQIAQKQVVAGRGKRKTQKLDRTGIAIYRTDERHDE